MTRDNYALSARGGWGHSSPASGDDGRSMSIRLEDPGNGSTIIELDIPVAVMMDLLTNTERSTDDIVSMTVYGLDAIGKRRDVAHLIIDLPATFRCEEGLRKGSRLVELDPLLKRDLEEHGWHWDEVYNGHRRIRNPDGYQLDCVRLVGQDAPHPSASLEEMLRHGVIHRGDCKTIVRNELTEAVTVEPPALRTASGEKLADIAKGKGKRK